MNASTANGCGDASEGEPSKREGMDGETETEEAWERNDDISSGEMRQNW